MSERHGYCFEDLEVGMTDVFSKTVTEADVTLFAGVTGDLNPVHIDQEFAAQSMFGGRIVHGMLTAGFISAVLGMRLPGPGCIYVSQTLRFKAPVRVGQTVAARVTVQELVPEKRRAIMATSCSVDGNVVLDGEATLLVNRRQAAQAAE